MKNTIQRIKEYIDFIGVSVSAFERQMGFSNGSFGSQLKNNKTIGVDKLEYILNIYKELNTEWLLRGNGNMILEIQKTLELEFPKNEISQDSNYVIELQKKYIKSLEEQLSNTKRTESIIYKPPKHKLASE